MALAANMYHMLLSIPVYPDSVRLGTRSLHLAAELPLCEDDTGAISFTSEEERESCLAKARAKMERLERRI